MRSPHLISVMFGIILATTHNSSFAEFFGRLPATPGGTDYQAYYDDQLDITWTADANIFGPVICCGGPLSINGVTGWGTPSMDVNSDTTYGETGPPFNGVIDCATSSQEACKDNQLGHLYYYGAGTTYGEGITSASPGVFSNVGGEYWSDTYWYYSTSNVWTFDFDTGSMGVIEYDNSTTAFSWLVRKGDVPPFYDDGKSYTIDYALTGGMVVSNSTTTNINTGAYITTGSGYAIGVYQSSTVNVNDGLIGGSIYADNAYVNVDGGSIDGSIHIEGYLESVELTVESGSIDRVSISNSADAIFNGGIVNYIYAEAAGNINIFGGTFTDGGGGDRSIYVYENNPTYSPFIIYGGTFIGKVYAHVYANLFIKGGNYLSDFEYTREDESTRLTLFGDLSIATPTLISGNQYETIVSGTLFDGSAFSERVVCNENGGSTSPCGGVAVVNYIPTWLLVSGAAQGGGIYFTVAGVNLSVATTSGLTHEQVIHAIASAVNNNSLLSTMGIEAVEAGDTVYINNEITDISETDNGLNLTYGLGEPPADGDINLDGEVNVADILLGMQVLNNSATLTHEQHVHADVAPLVGGQPDPDGLFNLGDLLVIERKALGLIDF